MPDDNYESDADIIRAAYADKVKEAFKVYAENVGMGQNQKSSTERFLRSLELVRRARDLALEAMSGISIVEPIAPGSDADDGDTASARRRQYTVDGISAADQAMIEQALAGTTGQKPAQRD